MSKKNPVKSMIPATANASFGLKKGILTASVLLGAGLIVAYYAWLEDEYSAEFETVTDTITLGASLAASIGFFSYRLDHRPATMYEQIEATPQSISFYPRFNYGGMGLSKNSVIRKLDAEFIIQSFGDLALRPKDCDATLEFGHVWDPHHEQWHSSKDDIKKRFHFHIILPDIEKYTQNKKSESISNPFFVREEKHEFCPKYMTKSTLECLLNNVAEFEKKNEFCLDGKTDCLIDKRSHEEAVKNYGDYLDAYIEKRLG